MKKKIGAVILAVALTFGLSACGKEIDKNIVGATKVQGTYNLWWFCEGSTLIYFEDNSGSDDEYVSFFSWGCDDKGLPTKELPGVIGDGNGGDTGNGEK